MRNRTALPVLIAAVLAAAVLSACSSNSPRPYTVRPSKAVVDEVRAKKWQRRPRVISLCYGNLWNSAENVLEEARFICKGGEVRLSEQDVLWTPCGLLQPVRATFLCFPPPKKADTAQ